MTQADTSGAFGRPSEYEDDLNNGLRLSGEEKHFFIHGRLADLRRQLPHDWSPKRVLDFGCGTGDTTVLLKEFFPAAEVVGTDAERAVLLAAQEAHGSQGVSFRALDPASDRGGFDLCYVNGVFHHIEPGDRVAVASLIRDVLRQDGRLALFENNPWNPGTRMVMKRIPFDRDARMLSALELRRLVLNAGFRSCNPARFLFYFPSPLRALRVIEPALTRVPFGAQYWVMATR